MVAAVWAWYTGGGAEMVGTQQLVPSKVQRFVTLTRGPSDRSDGITPRQCSHVIPVTLCPTRLLSRS